MADKITMTPEQHAKITEAIVVIEQVQQQLDDLEACGEACGERRVTLATVRQKAQNLLTRFASQ